MRFWNCIWRDRGFIRGVKCDVGRNAREKRLSSKKKARFFKNVHPRGVPRLRNLVGVFPLVIAC
jgi:hypothetical protein